MTELDEDLSPLRANRTGISHTVWISFKTRHAARIKIAVDPPDTLTLGGKTATMTIHDYKVTGADVPSTVIKQAEAFIEQNRDVLLRFWHGEIDAAEMVEQIRKPSGA
jgi:hypothetical protein